MAILLPQKWSDMSFSELQIEKGVMDIVDEELIISRQAVSLTHRNSIPDTTKIPIENPTNWLKIPNVVCVFIDMIGSTKLSALVDNTKMAKAYRLFTGTLIKVFDYYDSPYIDVKGDGVFALFDSDKVYTALVAAVTAKTIVEESLSGRIKDISGVEIGAHIGIDQDTILVRKLGLKRYEGRTDRQNEVWAGKTVNMAAKLASLSKGKELWVSYRFRKNLKDEKATMSCSCHEKIQLWEEKDVSNDDRFDFDSAYMTKAIWCSKHGSEYAKYLKSLDE